MAKKPNDHFVKIIQNSPKTADSDHSKHTKFPQDSQKFITVESWKAHARYQLYKN